MINSLWLADFKNFSRVRLRMGPFTVIVGANASGKSNLRDAFRFLHGIGRGYTLPDIIGGRYGAGGQVEWEQIRGTIKDIVRFGQSEFVLIVRMTLNCSAIEYRIVVGMDDARSGAFRVTAEQLSVGDSQIYTSYPGHPDPVQYQDDDIRLLGVGRYAALSRHAGGAARRERGPSLCVRGDRQRYSSVAAAVTD